MSPSTDDRTLGQTRTQAMGTREITGKADASSGLTGDLEEVAEGDAAVTRHRHPTRGELTSLESTPRPREHLAEVRGLLQRAAQSGDDSVAHEGSPPFMIFRR